MTCNARLVRAVMICLMGGVLACSARTLKKPEIPNFEAGDERLRPPLAPEMESEVATSNEAAVQSLKSDPPAIRPQKSRRRGRFQFSGDEFVKESGNNPFENKNDTIIRLKGHAKLTAKNVRISSPQIEVYGDDGKMAYARGPVEIVDTRNSTRITADEALFIRAENRAVLRGNAKLQAVISGKKKKKEKLQLTCAEIERNFDTSISVARGKVIATSTNGVLYADSAEFVEPQDTLRSGQNPRIFSGEDLFLADNIQWNMSKNTAEFQGHVRAYFSRSEEGQKKKNVDSAVRASEGTLVQDEALPHGQRLTLRKKVSIERKSYSAYSEEAEVFGSGAELVKARDQVVLINREENSKSFGDIFEWLRETGYMSLAARKGARTRTLLMNKKSVATAEIAASSITRAKTGANPQARGDVLIMQFSKDASAPPVRMGAEWAEVKRDLKIIQLNGSPYVEGELGRIGARDIILHYEEQRYEMLGILPGVVEKRMTDSVQGD